MQKQIVLKIHGKVQGVFFRATSQIEARELNLFGSVRNEMDGTIKIIAEGEDKDLKKFIEWCKYGPDHAEVEKVDVEWMESTNKFIDFKVI